MDTPDEKHAEIPDKFPGVGVVRVKSDRLLGIDLGGTKIEAALLDPDNPSTPVSRIRIPTGREKGYEHILRQIQRAALLACDEAKAALPDAIGIGSPGTLDPFTQTLHGSNTTCLNGRPLRDDLARLMGRRIELANDANCFALAEATLGAAKNFRVVFGIILGTGVGGGLVVDKHLLQGAHGVAGEWGQLVLNPQGPPSVHGVAGTIEAHIAGLSLEKFYEDRSGVPRRLSDIVERARATTDPIAQMTLDRLIDKFADALAMLVNSIDADAYVLGGGVGNIDELYSDTTRDKISARIFAPEFRAAILRPSLGDSAGVFGAAMLTARPA